MRYANTLFSRAFAGLDSGYTINQLGKLFNNNLAGIVCNRSFYYKIINWLEPYPLFIRYDQKAGFKIFYSKDEMNKYMSEAWQFLDIYYINPEEIFKADYTNIGA